MTKLTVEDMQRELAAMISYMKMRDWADPDQTYPWSLWADVCFEAAKDLALLVPNTPRCPTCGSEKDCDCLPPF